ncbi:MAG: SDR family oxidoreductase [Bacteroidota bacterium]
MKNKNAVLITGASSGIGFEFARVFASKGNNLVLVARRKNKLLELKKELESNFNISVSVIPLNLAEPKSSEELFSKLIKNNFVIDVLINNAGFGYYGEFLSKDTLVDEEMINLNILTLTKLTKLIANEMVKRASGKILNIGSTAGFQPGPLMSLYCATKAFVNSFSEALANELKGTCVTVSVLCPGATESEFRIVAGSSNSRIFHKRKIPTSLDVAEFGYKFLMSGKPIAIHGFTNKFLVFSARFTPRRIVVSVAKFFIKSR